MGLRIHSWYHICIPHGHGGVNFKFQPRSSCFAATLKFEIKAVHQLAKPFSMHIFRNIKLCHLKNCAIISKATLTDCYGHIAKVMQVMQVATLPK